MKLTLVTRKFYTCDVSVCEPSDYRLTSESEVVVSSVVLSGPSDPPGMRIKSVVLSIKQIMEIVPFQPVTNGVSLP